MKKHVLLLRTGAVLSLESFTQNTFPSSGYVGIGTTSPNTLLHVNGTLLTGSESANLDPSPANARSQLGYLSYSSSMLIGWNRSVSGGETDFISNQGPGRVQEVLLSTITITQIMRHS